MDLEGDGSAAGLKAAGSADWPAQDATRFQPLRQWLQHNGCMIGYPIVRLFYRAAGVAPPDLYDYHYADNGMMIVYGEAPDNTDDDHDDSDDGHSDVLSDNDHSGHSDSEQSS